MATSMFWKVIMTLREGKKRLVMTERWMMSKEILEKKSLCTCQLQTFKNHGLIGQDPPVFGESQLERGLMLRNPKQGLICLIIRFSTLINPGCK